ncbi:hypothetical protein SAMN06295912_101476 [Sphingomonas laterariae]|uniref:Uncharacterized protein n=2 Tax=Edaphosphingomonas laterariae TaxID=861865 RepID=A0A239BY79_9SPHN|nr:hypothetical protein SAMN06295912_101476 [Sphingomonas laterariae]
MLTTKDPTELLERAEMHEQLAAATDDGPARKMHQAMAAEYRRRAAEAGNVQIIPPAGSDPIIRLSAVAR